MNEFIDSLARYRQSDLGFIKIKERVNRQLGLIRVHGFHVQQWTNAFMLWQVLSFDVGFVAVRWRNGLYFYLLFPSACTWRRRGEMKLAVHIKLRSLGHRHAIGLEGYCCVVSPAPSRSGTEDRKPSIVSSAGWVTHGHYWEVARTFDPLSSNVLDGTNGKTLVVMPPIEWSWITKRQLWSNPRYPLSLRV